jgi:hypothetical protein
LVTVVSSASASPRILAPAPWWVLVAGFAAALLVPGWRRSPVTTLPAVAATLPWWPVPLPVAALLWTGPLAWLPILAALAAALGSQAFGVLGRRTRSYDSRRAPALVAAATLMMGAATWWSLSPRLPGGDEPHYLVVAQSLWLDGDLRIENNHAQRDYAEYFSGTLRPDYINRGQDGEIYSIHAPGVSALVLPGFVLAGLTGAQFTILLCLVGTAVLVWRAAWRATGDTTAAWFAWACVIGAATSLLLGVMVFPDGPAALGTAAAVWLLVELAMRSGAGHDVRARHFVLVSTVLAVLPWLHTRFAVLAAGLGLAIVIAVLTEAGRTPRARLQRLFAFLTVPAISAAGWFLQFWLIYGTADPRAPYRGAESVRDWIWGAVVGLYTDQQFGLFTFAPVLVAAVVGGYRATTRSLRWVTLASALILVVYTVAVASYHMWWAGLPGLPARFLTAALPLFAVPLAIGWARATGTGRAVLAAMLAVSWVMTALVVAHDHGAFAFNGRDGQAAWLEWLNPVVNLPRAWPSFFWRSEGAFLLHVGTGLGVWIVGWFVMRTFVRRHIEHAAVGRVAVACWVLLCLMGAAEAGWRLNGVSGLDPLRSQLAVHGAARTWPAGASTALTMRPDEAPLSDRPTRTLLVAGPVPAGDYLLSSEGVTPQAVTLSARIGRSPLPLRVWTLAPGTEIAMPLSLPAGAAALVLEADSPASASALALTLRPTGPARQAQGVARASSIAGGTVTYYLDDHVFVEPTGFWVRGGREAHLVVSDGPSAAGRTRPLRLRNGGAPNTVTVRVGGWSETVALDAWQDHTLTLPVGDPAGQWRVSIASASGFRPSEVGGGDDGRYLGVWVGQ